MKSDLTVVSCGDSRSFFEPEKKKQERVKFSYVDFFFLNIIQIFLDRHGVFQTLSPIGRAALPVMPYALNSLLL